MVSPKKASNSPKKGKVSSSPKKKAEKAETIKNDTKSSAPQKTEIESSTEPPKKKTKTKTAGVDDIITIRDPTPRTVCSLSEQIKIISWNVDGIRAPGRLEDFVAIVAEEKPDLICTQETKLQEPWEADWKSSLPGYDAVWSSCTAKKGYSGTGVFYRSDQGGVIKFGKGVESSASSSASSSSSSSSSSKAGKLTSFFAPKKKSTKQVEEVPVAAPEEVTQDSDEKIVSISFGIESPELDNEGRSITVEYKDFFVVNLYVPNAGMKLERLDYRVKEWNVALEKYVANLESAHSKPVVVLGDLNVAHRALDIYNNNAPYIKKQAGCTVEEREAFTQWLDKGYVDAFRHIHGDVKGGYTYWNTRAKNRVDNKGIRLDYFVVSESMTKESPQIVDSYILDNTTKVSDHAPVVLVVARS